MCSVSVNTQCSYLMIFYQYDKPQIQQLALVCTAMYNNGHVNNVPCAHASCFRN